MPSGEQIESILLPTIETARKEPSFAQRIPRDYGVDPKESSKNVYERLSGKPVVDAINFRLDQPIHKCTTPSSVTNTMKYLFFHMKCGIYVMIRNGKLRIFCPFTNSEYRNTWSDKLKIEGDGTLNHYYTQKAGLYREENIEPDMAKWWANGYVCFHL